MDSLSRNFVLIRDPERGWVVYSHSTDPAVHRDAIGRLLTGPRNVKELVIVNEASTMKIGEL